MIATRLLMVTIIHVLVFGCSQSQPQPRLSRPASFGAVEMQGFGNCLPFEIRGLHITDSFHLTDSVISSQCFISPNLIIAAVKGGQIYICNLETHETSLLAELGYDLVYVGPSRRTDFLVLSEYRYNGENPDGLRDLYCLTINGKIEWNIKEYSGCVPVVYNGFYVATIHGSAGNEQLCRIDRSGITILNNYIMSNPDQFSLIPADMGLIWTGFHHGPFLTRESENGDFLEELWHQNWDSGGEPIALASESKLIAFNVLYSGFIILDRTDHQALVVDYLTELAIPERELTSNLGFNGFNCLASTSDMSVILYGAHLIKYQNGHLEHWHEDLTKYTSDYYPISLYISKSANSFIVCMDHSVLIGNGDQVEELKFGDGRSGFWEFSEDFKTAAFGTGGMLNVVAFDIVE